MSQPWQQPPTGGNGQDPQQPGNGGQPGFGAPQTPPPGFAQQPPPQQPAYGAPQQAAAPGQAPGQPPQGAPGQAGYGYPGQPQTAPQPGYGYPQQDQQGAPQPGYGYPQPGGAPGAPGDSGDDSAGGPPQNLLFALGAALVAAVICFFAYGALYNAMTDESTGEVTQIGWVAVLIGVVVGLGPAFMAKRNWVAYIVGAVLALGAVYLGTLYGGAIFMADELSGLSLSAPEIAFLEQQTGLTVANGDGAFSIFIKNIGALTDVWTEGAEAMDYVFMALAPVGAIGVAQTVLRRSS
ncbi:MULTISPECIES: hypothetical protein [Streptomyces]|uniref:hypothetical protein n=2 Tax=Streptomyces TaxID=1883 RepID=UPI00159C12A3|nr:MULTISPECIES: hypothetical protein [Streptomyces]